MRKKTISRSIALAAGALLSTAVMAKPPNILVIMSDDVGWENVSAYSHGTMGYNTPNIDRIAKKSLCLPIIMHSQVQLQAMQPLLRDNIQFVQVSPR